MLGCIHSSRCLNIHLIEILQGMDCVKIPMCIILEDTLTYSFVQIPVCFFLKDTSQHDFVRYLFVFVSKDTCHI